MEQRQSSFTGKWIHSVLVKLFPPFCFQFLRKESYYVYSLKWLKGTRTVFTISYPEFDCQASQATALLDPATASRLQPSSCEVNYASEW